VIEFKLPDMTCGHCVARVTKALKEEDPAALVTVDLPTKAVRIESSHDAKALAAALAEAGYAPA
jgi:copper chaperone